MITYKSTDGISGSPTIVDNALEEEEKKLVSELLRLHRDGSSVTVIATKLRELREVRARLQRHNAPPPPMPVSVL
jgi:hypothetical protein